jgi:DNA-binding MarR family transcriptional regulator
VSGDGRTRAAAEPAAPADAIDLGMLPGLIGFQLRSAQLAVFQHFNRSLGDAGISPPQFGTLVLIEANPGISQSAVAAALRFDRSTLVQIIDRLEDSGLVVREPSSRDRRTHALKLTAQGGRLLADLKRRVRAHEAAIAGALSESERETLVALLARVQRGSEG